MRIKPITYILGAFIGIIAIVLVNYQIIGAWFGKEGPANLGSIEVSYVSMGRFLRDFGFKSWAPFWYLGFPFHLFYTPLLPFLEMVLASRTAIDLWVAYRLVTGISYVLVPVSLLFLAWQLSKTFVGGLISAMLYSVGPTIFYFILPSTKESPWGEVAADRISVDFWDPRRFTILVRWGEGPHTLSLVFVPLVGVFFARLVKKPRPINILSTAFFLGLTALSNSLGFFVAILLVLTIALVAIARKPKKRARILIITALAGLTSWGLVSFWYNLSFLTNFFGEGQGIIERYLSFFPWGWAAVVLGIFFVYEIVKRVLKDFGVAVSLIWFLIFFVIVFVYYLSAPPELSELRLELLPQALRYNTEVDMAASLLIGTVFGAFILFLDKRIKILGILGRLGGLAVVVGLFFYATPFIPTATNAAGQVVNLEKTREKEIADWLASNLEIKKGERVFVPGNYGFYLNWYKDVWQARGGLFQAATHPWVEHIHFQLVNGEDAEIAKAWLKIINAKYALVTTPASSELYKEVKNLKRFEELPVVYQEKGDIIYEVPLKNSSPVKLVSLEEMGFLGTPQKADDKKALLSYVDWLENSSVNKLSFEMINHDTYEIKGSLRQGEAILVQTTYDAGWRAYRSFPPKAGRQGKLKRVRVGKDPMAFLILYPEAGDVEIKLTHSSTWSQWLGWVTTLAIVGFIATYGFWMKFARKSYGQKVSNSSW